MYHQIANRKSKNRKSFYLCSMQQSIEITAERPLIEYFYYWERTTPHKILFRQPIEGQWKEYSWQEAGRQARSLAAYLRSLNLAPHSHIGLVSKNCAEWFICDLAIMMSGHVSVPFYPTLTSDQLNQVLVHSDCKVLFVGKLDGWKGMKPGVPADMTCISFPTYNPDPAHLQWNDLIVAHEPIVDSPVPSPDDLLTVIYTSGTTGNPKGVMLSYRNFSTMLFDIRGFLRTETIANPHFFSYLPLSHIAERAYLENGGFAVGALFSFSENLDTFGQNIADSRPTHIGSVPRIWVKFQHGILAKMPQKKLDRLLKIPILSSIVKKKIRTKLGINDASVILVGAAPMPVILLQWFRKLDVKIQEVYGMTENTGAVSAMPPERIKDGTVGKVHLNTTLKLDEGTGEICTKAPYNMLGYYKEPAMTADTIDADGWLHTGDVGTLDADGYLTITGRVKEMYKTTKGEYVAPAQIELKFAESSLIEQVCVVGNHLPQPIALVVLSEEGRQLSFSELSAHLETTLTHINPTLKPYERVQRIVVMNEPWTVENDKMTPTLKLKRNVIEKTFGGHFEEWSEARGAVIKGA